MEEVHLYQREQEFIDGLIVKYKDRPGMLLSLLEEIQESQPHKYLPMVVLDYLAGKIDVPRAQLYSVVTFFALFNLKPQGEHTVCICRGTACHTRGSRNLLERSKLQLGLKPASPCEPSPASGSARWRRWWKWITPSTAT